MDVPVRAENDAVYDPIDFAAKQALGDQPPPIH